MITTQSTEAASFPHLYALWETAGRPGATFREAFFAPDATGLLLEPIEQSLAILRPHWPIEALSSQCRALFDGTEASWNMALTELLALATFQQRGELAGIGWPPGGGGDTPPFDGVLRLPTGQLPFDVKPAYGSGFFLLRETLLPVLRRWGERVGLSPLNLKTQVSGTLTQLTLGRERERVQAVLERYLADQTTIPALPLELVVGSAQVRVEIVDKCYSLGTAVGGVLPRAESVGETVAGQVLKKLSTARKERSPFLLVYVSPFGSGGADFSEETLPEVLDSAESKLAAEPDLDLWQGLYLLRYRANAPNAVEIVRKLRVGLSTPAAR